MVQQPPQPQLLQPPHLFEEALPFVLECGHLALDTRKLLARVSKGCLASTRCVCLAMDRLIMPSCLTGPPTLPNKQGLRPLHRGRHAPPSGPPKLPPPAQAPPYRREAQRPAVAPPERLCGAGAVGWRWWLPGPRASSSVVGGGSGPGQEAA
jgi:hypothetical protein